MVKSLFGKENGAIIQIMQCFQIQLTFFERDFKTLMSKHWIFLAWVMEITEKSENKRSCLALVLFHKRMISL